MRDVYCMGADVTGVMDPLRFGDPTGPNAARVRDIASGVVDGIAQYGNALGVPTYGGETYFDASFDDNCLGQRRCLRHRGGEAASFAAACRKKRATFPTI